MPLLLVVKSKRQGNKYALAPSKIPSQTRIAVSSGCHTATRHASYHMAVERCTPNKARQGGTPTSASGPSDVPFRYRAIEKVWSDDNTDRNQCDQYTVYCFVNRHLLVVPSRRAAIVGGAETAAVNGVAVAPPNEGPGYIACKSDSGVGRIQLVTLCCDKRAEGQRRLRAREGPKDTT
jgi:hypothetical protein